MEIQDKQGVGDQVQSVSQHSTDELLHLATASKLHDIRFSAQFAINIMDRSYKNDVLCMVRELV